MPRLMDLFPGIGKPYCYITEYRSFLSVQTVRSCWIKSVPKWEAFRNVWCAEKVVFDTEIHVLLVHFPVIPVCP